jgi:arylsulfatase A-like enzyme
MLAAMAASKPATNVILILADDLGYGDLGCYGSQTGATPHLDEFAAESLRFTNHYTCSPVCSPARAGLLTGMVPDRTGITGVLRDQDDGRGLSLSLTTLPQLLQRQGMRTALIGKWHLGMGEPYRPNHRGFDFFWGFLNGTIDYDTHLSKGGGATGQRTTYENGRPIELTGYFPELAAAKAVEFVESNRDRPYFLYLPLALPHTPIQAPEHWVSPFRGRMPASQAVYNGMLRSMDDGIGQLCKMLKRTQQWDRTAVIFLSDHGWVKKRPPAGAGSNGPFRGGKYELWEGGIRVPCIARWPGITRAGTTTDALSWLCDWFSTLTGARSRDGIDLRRVLAGKPAPDRDLCWRFEDPAVQTPLTYAIRSGQWKLIRGGKNWQDTHLYDLVSDPGENNPVESSLRSRLLQRKLHHWESGLPWVP